MSSIEVVESAAFTLGHQVRVWRQTLQGMELELCAQKLQIDTELLARIEDGDATVPIEYWFKCWYAMNTLENVIASALDQAMVLGAAGKALFGALDEQKVESDT